MDEEKDNEQLKGAVEFLLRTLLGNGKNYAQANALIDGQFYRVHIKIEPIVEEA